jgi:hypothetical protein
MEITKYAEIKNISPRTTRNIILNTRFFLLMKNKTHIIKSPKIMIAEFRKVAPYLMMVKIQTIVTIDARIIENKSLFI